MVVFEYVGVIYDMELVNIVVNEQNLMEYLLINFVGKVFVLRVGDKFFIENVVIIGYFDQFYLDVGFLFVVLDLLDVVMMCVNFMWCLMIFYLIF